MLVKRKFTTEITAEAMLLCSQLIAHRIQFSYETNVIDNTHIIQLEDSNYEGTFRKLCTTVTGCGMIV